MSQEKIFHLKALGAEVMMTRSDVGRGHPEYYQDVAERLERETPGAFYVNQFANPANPKAHEERTGPEIWRQMDGEVDAVVCGVGSGGTLTGLSRFFPQVAPEVNLVLADPAGSVLADYVRTGILGAAGSWLVEGIGEDFIPPICRPLAGTARPTPSRHAESFATARTLLTTRGHLRRARPRARCSPRRSSIAGAAAGRSAWSPSSATAATNTCRRCTTITGWPTRASSSASRTAICATSSLGRMPIAQ